MAVQTSLPVIAKFPEGLAPAADAGGRTSAYVSLKNVVKAYVVVYMDQGNAATVTLSVLQATAVAGTGSKAISNACPIWANQDSAASDTLVAQTAATTFTTSAAVKHKIVMFEIIPQSHLDLANGYDCIAVSTGASNAANITSALFFLTPLGYQQATPPSALTD